MVRLWAEGGSSRGDGHRVCGACGFDLTHAPDELVTATIADARTTFGRPLDGAGGDESARRAGLDGWSPLEHIVHVADSLDESRRTLLLLAAGEPVDPSVHIEAPHVVEPTVSTLQALTMLELASASLLEALSTLRAPLRDAEDTHIVLIRAAHEVTHHQALVEGAGG